jgi:hypothetical protein
MIHWLYDFTRPGGESKADGISRGARPPVDMVHVSLSGRRQPTVAEQLCIALWHRARIRSATNKLYLLLKKKLISSPHLYLHTAGSAVACLTACIIMHARVFLFSTGASPSLPRIRILLAHIIGRSKTTADCTLFRDNDSCMISHYILPSSAIQRSLRIGVWPPSITINAYRDLSSFLPLFSTHHIPLLCTLLCPPNYGVLTFILYVLKF